MQNLPKEYTLLFNGLTDTLTELEALQAQIYKMQAHIRVLQQQAEQLVIEREEQEEDLVYIGGETLEVS